jgi:hypothetical protein
VTKARETTADLPGHLSPEAVTDAVTEALPGDRSSASDVSPTPVTKDSAGQGIDEGFCHRRVTTSGDSLSAGQSRFSDFCHRFRRTQQENGD